jgi:pyridinium-3,5-biscarboxylic acid mononucleotide sulfurtransferase
VDSALVMAVAHQELGARALACIGMSPSYPRRELRDAVNLAGQLGVPHRVVDTREYADPNYAANASSRCYFCKTELYNRLRAMAAAEGWNAILDGSHLDDVGDHSGGMSAAREHGVRSPLLEAGIRKADIRALARELGLPVWDKPAMACLSSRVPHGTAITPELLKRIEAAEDVLAELGFSQFRVRHHGELARIELPVQDFPNAFEFRSEIIIGVQRAGYRYVTIDLSGFRSEAADEPELVQLTLIARSS